MPPFYFMTQKLRGLSFYFPKTTNIAKTSSVKAFIADNETPTSPPTRVFHNSVSNGTVKLTLVRFQMTAVINQSYLNFIFRL
ncbi:hypothetical protein CQA26_01010 [Providencia rettgeri]|nr:hypothetical protein CQA26_01010 [Providencia rettgeri]PYZ60337.1 hypothetical protein DNK63_15000 [Providencia rettgeri]